jgi:hypothetical protein
MATELRLRRGTTAQNAAFTGAMAELTVDTQTKSLIVHDGVTPGGFRQATPGEVAAAVAGKQDALGFTPENVANKAQPNGYASLDGTGKVPAAQLPTDIGAGAEIITPTNVAPANGVTNQPGTPSFQGSQFFSQYSQTHAATQLQISLVSNFASTVYDSGDGPATLTPAIPAGVLSVTTTYHWRLRYKNSRGTYSSWSNGTSFVTAAQFNNYIPTPAATPAIGANFEGGFYTGLIWNELTQSSTSTTIGTGTRSFTVPSMTSAPIVYAGQSLEVRSRANPNNKMIGLVTGAVGTTLTLNITSIVGSGTFTDWSVMARYRLVVAPKASGEVSNIAIKNTESALPVDSRTVSEGRKSTLAMIAGGSSTVYPAAYWAAGLTIGGRTDWYIPSRDEMEVFHRNLKATVGDNTTTTRTSAAAHNYQTLGSYGGAGGSVTGTNLNSIPQGAGYLVQVPDRTTVTAFASGGTEAVAQDGSSVYQTSSDFSGIGAVWYTQLHNSAGGVGAQVPGRCDVAVRMRAFRRSII